MQSHVKTSIEHAMDSAMNSIGARAGAIGVGLLSAFNAIPWANIAGFLSVIWLLMQMWWAWKAHRRDKQ